MADLIITAAVLEDSAAKLAAIKSEFDHVSDHSNADPSIWGQRDLASGMRQFDGDWKIHRKHISEAVEGLRKKLEEMAAGFDDTEQKLANSLETESTSE